MKERKEIYTFFNEEWNQPFWEDDTNVINQRKLDINSLVED